jgi:curved DNA-binding protein CbpA
MSEAQTFFRQESKLVGA